MPSIFISYRRSDAAGHAGRLYDQLVNRFGEPNVFKDIDTLEPGADFAEVIEDTIARCDAVLVVIGSDWMSPRLADPDDWVRLEVGGALTRGVRVVPVLVEGAKLPDASELPEELGPLVRRNAVELTEASWNAQVSDLVDRMGRVLGAPQAEAPAPIERSAEAEGWRVEVRRVTKRDRELELWLGETRRLLTAHAGRVTDKIELDGESLPFARAENSKQLMVARFILETPAGQSEGQLVWRPAGFSGYESVQVQIDDQEVYADIGGRRQT